MEIFFYIFFLLMTKHIKNVLLYVNFMKTWQDYSRTHTISNQVKSTELYIQTLHTVIKLMMIIDFYAHGHLQTCYLIEILPHSEDNL